METIKRTKIVDLLKSTAYGSTVNVKGWVRTRRGSKQVSFIALNDGSTINNVQIVVDVDKFGEDFLKPITTAPYYVARHFPSGYGSLGGIQVNENMQVLNNDLDPIPGLSACGTDSATVFADSYCFYNPGSTMSYAINSGRIAGMEAVAYMDSDEFIDPED